MRPLQTRSVSRAGQAGNITPVIGLVLLILATIVAFGFTLVGFDVWHYEYGFGLLGLALMLYFLSRWPWGGWVEDRRRRSP